MSPTVIRALGLRWRRRSQALLADGSVSQFNIYEGTVVWDKERRFIPIDEADATPLVGMAMLHGYHLGMDVRTKGRVEITQLD